MAKNKKDEEVLGDGESFGEGQEGFDEDVEDQDPVFEEDFDDVFEETVLENGEHEFEIIRAKWEATKKTKDLPEKDQRHMLSVTLCPKDDEYASDVRDWMVRESAHLGDTRKTANSFKLKRLSFYTAFGIDYTAGPVVVADIIGLTGFAETVIQDDQQYGKQATIKRYVTGE